MIAKLVTHAASREQAIDAQAAALDAFVIDGIRHNIPFLAALMQHPRWRAGQLSTAFIAEEYPEGFQPIRPAGEAAQVLAAVASAVDLVAGERKRRISGQLMSRPVIRERRRAVWLDDAEVCLDVLREHDAIVVRFDEAEGHAWRLRSAWKPGDAVWTGTVDAAPVSVQVHPILNGFALAWRGIQVKALVYTEREAAAARLMPVKTAADSGKMLRCPMPGLVVSIAVTEGQEVKACLLYTSDAADE